MAPKAKGKAKAKASAADLKKEKEAAAEEEAAKALYAKRGEETQWAQAQLSALTTQQVEDTASIAEAHKWHEGQKGNLLKCLNAKIVDVIPAGMRAGVESYVSQCAEGCGLEVQAAFKEHRDIYAELPDMETVYVRPPDKANLSLIEECKAHADCEWDSMEYFAKFYVNHGTSAEVNDAGLRQLYRLMDKHTDKDGKRSSKADGLEAATLMPAVAAVMRKYLSDNEIQRLGCCVITLFALMNGQLKPMLEEGGGELCVEAKEAHPRVVDVNKAADVAMKAMASKATPEDLELMAGAGIAV